MCFKNGETQIIKFIDLRYAKGYNLEYIICKGFDYASGSIEKIGF